MSKMWETDVLSSVRGEEGVCDVNEHECMQVHVECVWEGGREEGEVGAKVQRLGRARGECISLLYG